MRARPATLSLPRGSGYDDPGVVIKGGPVGDVDPESCPWGVPVFVSAAGHRTEPRSVPAFVPVSTRNTPGPDRPRRATRCRPRPRPGPSVALRGKSREFAP